MAYYLVSVRPITERLRELEVRLIENAFVGLELFGRALTGSLKAARRFPNVTVHRASAAVPCPGVNRRLWR